MSIDAVAAIRDWTKESGKQHPVDLIMDLVSEYGEMLELAYVQPSVDDMIDRITDAVAALAERDRIPYG